MNKKKVILIILDGWGIAQHTEASAVNKAHTPFIDSLYTQHPHCQLIASGLAVGLPEGQMGNSEVGHMNIGAGRVVYQDLVKINKAIEDQSLDHHPALNQVFDYVKTTGKNLHFMGLVSDGGVHSHIHHVKALCSIAHKQGIAQLYIHAFTDGRDTDPHSGYEFLASLQDHMKATTGQLASVVGRYYAMDRDNRWERIKIAYDLLLDGKGEAAYDILPAVKKSYQNGIGDEFIKPIVAINKDHNPIGNIQPGDAVLCFNFRTDRGREITQVLTQMDLPEYNMKTHQLHYTTLTNYDDTFEKINVIFDKDNLKSTLGDILAKEGKKQIRIAETEKYPHVTFFFSGGREDIFTGESRILCPSPKVATYDLQPEMSAHDIRSKIVSELSRQTADFICLNFANPDMVGHTGVFQAAVKACETVDQCAREVTQVARENGYTVLIIADHGNAEVMMNPDGTAHTAHTTNPVPCILMDDHYKGSLKNGKLADIAPTILTLMDLPIPPEMSGHVLIN